jgi:hypothetical protein
MYSCGFVSLFVPAVTVPLTYCVNIVLTCQSAYSVTTNCDTYKCPKKRCNQNLLASSDVFCSELYVGLVDWKGRCIISPKCIRCFHLHGTITMISETVGLLTTLLLILGLLLCSIATLLQECFTRS